MKSFPQDLIATIEQFEYDDPASDLPAMFNCFDHPRSCRSDEDYMSVVRAGYPDLIQAGVTTKFLVSITSAIAFHEREEHRGKEAGPGPKVAKRLPAHREYGWYLDQPKYREFVLWLWDWRESLHASFISRIGITSEILADWKYNPTLATQFWGEVFEESNADVDSDSRELIRAIQDMAAGARSLKQSSYQKKAHRIWNQFRKLREAENKAANGKKTVDLPFIPPPASREIRPEA